MAVLNASGGSALLFECLCLRPQSSFRQRTSSLGQTVVSGHD